MKILRLSLNNLASLAGTHHIHFDDAPLAYAGLIAITGKTGAGKSTLLDAMCLALYNEIPRLKGAAGSLKDIGGQEISIKDAKNILRRGTTSGFAELEFIALDGKSYQARWEIRRARNKIDGNLKVERAITCLDDQCLLNHKISEATPIIEKLIGLSFEQFTRAVLLAQSEVGAFLKAKDHERADLLEYLTNSHIFSLVSIKAAEKFSQVKQQRVELENLIGHIEMLSQEEIGQLQQQQKAYVLHLQNLQQSEKLLENEKKWHLDRNRIYADVQGKKEIYDVQRDAIEKLAPQQQLLEQLDQFQSIRDQFIQRARLQPLHAQTLQQQTVFLTSFTTLQQQVSHEHASLKALKDAQKQFEQRRLDLKPHLERGLKLDHDIHSITEQYKKLTTESEQFEAQRIQPLQRELTKVQANLNQFHTQQYQIGLTLEYSQYLQVFDQEPQSTLKALKQFAQQHAQLQQTQPEYFKLPATQLQQQLDALHSQLKEHEQQQQSLDVLEQHVRVLQQKYQKHQTHLIQLKHQQQQLVQLKLNEQEAKTLDSALLDQQQTVHQQAQSIQTLITDIETKEKAFLQLEQILVQQRILHTQNVQSLRAQLKPDAPCMVCGSLEHPFIHNHQVLEQGLLQLQEQQLQQSKQQLETLKAQLQTERIEHFKQQTRVEQQQQRLAQLKTSMQQQWLEMEQVLSTLELCFEPDSNTQEREQYVIDHIHRLNQTFVQLQQQQQQQQDLIQHWRHAQHAHQQLQLHLKQRLQLEQSIEPILQVLPEAYQKGLTCSWINQVQEQLQARIESLTTLKQIKSQQQATQHNLEKIQYQLQTEQQNFEQLQNTKNQLIDQGKELRQQVLDLTSDYAGQPYRLAAEWQNALELEAQHLNTALEQQRVKTTQLEYTLHQANLKQQSFISQLQQIEHDLEQVELHIQTWQLAHPTVNVQSIEQWLAINLSTHQAMRRDLNNQKQLLENAKTAWQLLEEQYQTHLKLKPEHELEEIEQHLSQIQQDQSMQQNQLNELETKLRINANNQTNFAKYQHQIELTKAEEYRWGRIYDLIGHREGTKFQKIAQEHHLDILVEYANQQLQPLAPRYQLHRVPDSLSLAIIDLDMNSEVRPVLSLSGGETFLVSLALALAIANMAAGSMKLESLFIDEGFGTLDASSLHMVMNALDQLQSQGRKVVLISHIQEMHERIPVQIQVRPLGAGASTIEVVG